MSNDETLRVHREISDAVAGAISNLLTGHRNPALVISEVPEVLAAFAGCYHLQLVRSQLLADGECDRKLKAMVAQMFAAADPVANPPTGREVPKADGRLMRLWLRWAGRNG